MKSQQILTSLLYIIESSLHNLGHKSFSQVHHSENIDDVMSLNRYR